MHSGSRGQSNGPHVVEFQLDVSGSRSVFRAGPANTMMEAFGWGGQFRHWLPVDVTVRETRLVSASEVAELPMNADPRVTAARYAAENLGLYLDPSLCVSSCAHHSAASCM